MGFTMSVETVDELKAVEGRDVPPGRPRSINEMRISATDVSEAFRHDLGYTFRHDLGYSLED